MELWHWRAGDGLPYLACSLLAPWPHGFFTRQFAPRSPEGLTPLLADGARPYRVKQVHGNRVLHPAEIDRAIGGDGAGRAPGEAGKAPGETPRDRPEADGVLTDAPHQAAWTCTADCTPALVGDRRTGRAAAIHAGWRGTASEILPKAIARFLADGSVPEDLRVALGPAIAGRVYQVDDEVADRATASLRQDRETLEALPDPPILSDPAPGKARLDVRRVLALQLAQCGLHPAQVAIAPHCTYQEPERFFSYRRDGTKTVQWSGIVSVARP